MIFYLDSSAAVKLYAREEHTHWLRATLGNYLGTTDAAGRRGSTAVASITYVEMRAAFAAKLRDGAFVPENHDQAVARLKRAFRDGFVMRSVPDAVMERAGDLAQKHTLRGYDAVQLAVALSLREELQQLAEQIAQQRRNRLDQAREVLSGEMFERFVAAMEEPPAPEEVLVMSFDNALHDAAVREEIAHERPDRPGGRRFDS